MAARIPQEIVDQTNGKSVPVSILIECGVGAELILERILRVGKVRNMFHR